MPAPAFDLVTVGGGLGGATLARVMAERGARVLAVERERRFSDRVRGELLMPWGVGEARTLGVEPLLRDAGGRYLRWNDMFYAGARIVHRDLPATTPQGAPWIAFYHPAMQESVVEAAARAGAEVWRGARARDVRPGAMPAVVVEREGRVEEVRARLVVGADGRSSLVRRWAGFPVRKDPERLFFAGVLLDDVGAGEDAGSVFFNPDIGRISLFFPQGGGRVRAYVGYHKDADPPRFADGDIRRFVEEAVRAGAEPGWLAGARAAGPLATFDGADTWVEHPYRDGVALVGDAAATSDPTWGQGMSTTLRDVRTLSERLLADDDWTAAGNAYATEHDRYYGVLHAVESWYADFFMEIGPAAEARRSRALPLIAGDPTRIPDAPFAGLDLPADDGVRRRFFAED
jgi:2-polyprenyl-6-methoxyphenol hydroxylase-like FAD-dependent oxidoreductase